jgi:IS30 family transposase
MTVKLHHCFENSVRCVAQDLNESVLLNVGRCTPCIHKVSRNNKNNDKKFMNESIVSAEAKARLTEAVKNYTPPPPEKYRALEEVKDCIIELRDKKASYQTIRTILKNNAGIEVSHQTIARYCRETLESSKTKKPRRSKTPTAEQPPSAQTEPQPRPHIGHPRPRGPRIADSKNL